MKLTTYILFSLLCLPGLSRAGNWFIIDGRYATVEYQAGHEVIADSLLHIAEQAVPRLAALHGLPLENLKGHKVRIVFTDAPDVSNGYALSDGIAIYALSSMYLTNWSSEDTWYRQVLVHELAHYITFRKIRRKFNLFGELANLTVPRWFYEGLAQYYAETWNAFRGDLYLKNALLYGKLNYDALKNLNDGRLLYATAHAFVRYLASQYGDSSLIRLMSHNRGGWFLDFNKAFKSVYGKKPAQLFPDFIRHLVLYYGGKLAPYPTSADYPALPERGYRTLQIIPVAQGDSTYILVSQQNQVHQYASAFVIRVKAGKVARQKFLTDNLNTPIVLSPDQSWLAYGRYALFTADNQDGLALKWNICALAGDESQQLPGVFRARSAVFTDNSTLVLADVRPDQTIFKSFRLGTDSVTTLFKTTMPVGRLEGDRQNGFFFSAQDSIGSRGIYHWNGKNVSLVTAHIRDARNPVLLNEQQLLFNRMPENQPAIALLDLDSGESHLLLQEADHYWLRGYDHQHREVIVSTWQADRDPVFLAVPLDSLLAGKAVLPPRPWLKHYRRWTEQRAGQGWLPDTAADPPVIPEPRIRRLPQFPMSHIFSIAWPSYDNNWGLNISGLTSWLEILRRQSLALTFSVFQKKFDRSLVALSHLLRARNLVWLTSYYHGPVIFSFRDGQYVDMYQDMFALQARRYLFLNGNPRFRLSLLLGYQYNHYNLYEQVEDLEGRFLYHGPSLEAGFRYLKPTSLYPFIAKKEIQAGIKFFQSLDHKYDFSLLQLNASLAGNLFMETLGLRWQGHYARRFGPAPAMTTLGIDRFYEFDLPRDLTFTKTIRGLRRDISGNELLWNSFELSYLYKQKSAWKLINIPLSNMGLTAFADFARVGTATREQVYSYGGELSFGQSLYRLAGGTAWLKGSDKFTDYRLYMRLALFLPE